MIHSQLSFRLPSKTSFLSLVAGLSFLACTKKHHGSTEELPSGRFVQQELPVTPAQTKSLGEELEAQLADSLDSIFASELFGNDALKRSQGQVSAARVSRAMALSFARDMTARVQRSKSTHCVSSPERTLSFLSCLVFESVEDNLQNVRDAEQWIAGFSRIKDSSGKLIFSDAEAQELAQSLPVTLVKIFADSQNVEKILLKLNRAVDGSLRALEILSAQQASLDMPYLAESFIKGRQYVLTTSLQQASVGKSRVFNLDSMIVRLEINNNRLIVIRSGDGLYSGSSQEDLIVGAYPVKRTVQPAGQSESYFQIDFSHPENKSFLVSALGEGQASLQLSADVVVPRIAHAAKPVLGEMSNGLYFNQKDQNFVIDQLVLLNANASVFGDENDASGEGQTIKDGIRPTVHVVQGFFPLPTGNDPFEINQAMPLSVSQGELRARGVSDRTDNKDVPFFATKGFYEGQGGRARTLTPYVRKFNFQKEMTFVLSRGVPTAFVPVLKSAVLSYKELFDSLATKDVPAPLIRVFTQDEFEQANRTEGLALGGAVSAADPRVNMIYWDDALDLGSAWATATENPKTGEIISGDVMLSGSMWAMEGCKGYFQRTWQKDKEPNLPKRPAGRTPSPITRFLWDVKCDAALSHLGVFKARSSQPADPANRNSKLVDFDRANRTGDLASLAQHASELLGRTVLASEMVSNQSQGTVASVQSAAATLKAVDELKAQFNRLQKNDGSLNDKVTARVRSLEKLTADDDTDSLVKSMVSGQNIVRAKLDCVRNATPNADVQLAEAGAPRIESQFVTSPETGALALVRSVVVHELGHVFGLRHNFIGSTTPAVLADDSKPPVAIDSGTDSIMDYNDYGIEMTAGAMRDFSSPEGALGLGTFGAYDVLALATVYGLPTDQMKFKTGPAFCTDRNVTLLGNCQRFDFGKDYNEYLLHRINLILQRLRYASPLDAILDPRLPGVYAQLLSTVSQELLKMNALWGVSQSAAAESTDSPLRSAYLQVAELAFRGVGARQDFVKNFSGQYGSDLVATFGAMRLPANYFANEDFGAVLSSLIRKEMDLNMIAVTRLLQSRAQSKGSDSAYLGVVSNLVDRGSSCYYLDDLVDHFATRVVVPAGRTYEFDYFYDGQRRTSGDAKRDGKPFVLTLAKPLFNHQAQIVAVPNVVLDGPAPGSQITVTAMLKGNYSIDDMLRSIAGLVVLGGDNPLHPARVILRQQAKAIDELLQAQPCKPPTEDTVPVTVCEQLRAEARAPATVILDSLASASQGVLPASRVATGGGR